MAKFIGSDCTYNALEWLFRRYRAGAKLQKGAVAAGQDLKNINVDVNPQGKPDGKGPSGASSMSRLLNNGSIASALEHVFRPIKKEGTAMKAAISREYGGGVTGKAVSTYFERARKDPNWNRANPIEEKGSSAEKATPRKRKSPAKKTKDAGGDDDGDDDDDDEEETGSALETPSKKKPALNKVLGGRITKSSPRSSAAPKSYNEDSENKDKNSEIKEEHMEGASDDYQVHHNGYSNGHGNGYANGNGHPYAEDEGAENFYEVQEEA